MHRSSVSESSFDVSSPTNGSQNVDLIQIALKAFKFISIWYTTCRSDCKSPFLAEQIDKSA